MRKLHHVRRTQDSQNLEGLKAGLNRLKTLIKK